MAQGARRSERKAEDKAKVTLKLSSELVRQAKHYAIDHDVDLQDLVAAALRAYLPKAGR
jgi:predicted DNA binding CopG/RHH family protein